MSDRPPLIVTDGSLLTSVRSRRDALKVMAMGGVLVFLPAAFSACGDDKSTNPTTPPLPNSGSSLVIYFSKGDIAVLQFAYALEPLEAAFYTTKVVAAFGGSNLTAAEKRMASM